MSEASAGIPEMRHAVVRMTAGLVVAAAMATGSMVWADQAATTAPKSSGASKPFVKESLHEMTATVEKISPATRELTLKGPSGQSQTVKVGPEARNFDQIHVGDHVTVSYYESFMAQMRKHGKPNEGFGNAAGAVRSAPGEKPGGAAAQSTASTVTIDSVDTKNNTVTFHRPDGGSGTIPVQSPEGREFIAKLKAGDVVDVMYVEAVAVEVAPAPGK